MILLDAANPFLENVNREERYHIPGYDTVYKSFENGEELKDFCEKYQINEEVIQLLNPLLNVENVCLPIRITADFLADSLSDLNQYSYEKLVHDINYLQRNFPFIKVNVIGKSILQKNIFEIKIGNGSYETHMNAAFHGNEWITSSLLMKCICNYLIDLVGNSNDVLSFFENHALSLVPMVNPDGVNLVINGSLAAEKYQENVIKINEDQEDFSKWKANIVGVDLNKQYPALWDVEKERQVNVPHYRDYPGDKALSQPEAIAIESLVKRSDFERIYAFHTQGEEIYWGFQGLEPNKSANIVKKYEEQTAYEAVQYVNNYAGFKDWFIQSYQRPGFTIEFGKGMNPLPFEQFDAMYEVAEILFYENLKKNKRMN